MNEAISEFFNNCTKNSPVSTEVLDTLPKSLPENYLNLLKFSNGIEGTVKNGSYLQLWKAEDLQKRNDSYLETGAYRIGSDGGEEVIVIDLREGSKFYGNYYRIPNDSFSWDTAKMLGSDVTDISIF